MTPNPYSFGMGIPDPTMFVGRHEELLKAVPLLSGPAHSCVALLGATRMGKTSLLDRIRAIVHSEDVSPPVRCASLTLLSLRDRDTMFEPLVNVLCDAALRVRHPGKAAFTPDGFLRWLESLHTPMALFIDDFDD